MQEKKKKELEELEATLAEFGIEGAGGGDAKPSTAVRAGRLASTLPHLKPKPELNPSPARVV